ncbi:hypothetical protein V5R04_15480 [Jonesiaceae bacterium BS-20]|uniref:Uncharacterized protein n=1 Tax=Jonesiaceae bacterium BS-20 TaxID=3120821 RepID=A0AAU7DXY0_9MICO
MEIWISIAATFAAALSVVFAVRANGKSNTANLEAAKANEIAQAALDHQTRYVPPWDIEWSGGSAFRLVNRGTETEYDVHLKLDWTEEEWSQESIAELQPNASLLFYPVFAWVSGRGATVSWSRTPGGPVETWKSMVPVEREG